MHRLRRLRALLLLTPARAKLAWWALTKFIPIAGAQDPPPADPPPADPPKDPPKDPPADKTFTQADLDRIVQDRLARQAKQFEGFDDLRAKAEEFDKLQEQQLSELDREKKAREKAEADAAKKIEAANRRLIEAAVLAQATAQKAIKPEHMHRLINTDTVTVADDGQVTGAEEAVKAFLEANPEYVGKSAPPPGDADQGARKTAPNQLSREELASMSPEAVRKAVADGRLANVLSG